MTNMTKNILSRRRFLHLAYWALGAICVAKSHAIAGALPLPMKKPGFIPTPDKKPVLVTSTNRDEKRLKLYTTHNQETLDIAFAANGRLLPDHLERINVFLRDHYDGTICRMDPDLLMVLHNMQRQMNFAQPLHVISAYRSRHTNDMLRRKGSGVAKNSFHVKGMATDLRVPGISTRQLQRLAKSVRGGGVGFYPRSRFVHVDSGPLRYW